MLTAINYHWRELTYVDIWNQWNCVLVSIYPIYFWICRICPSLTETVRHEFSTLGLLLFQVRQPRCISEFLSRSVNSRGRITAYFAGPRPNIKNKHLNCSSFKEPKVNREATSLMQPKWWCFFKLSLLEFRNSVIFEVRKFRRCIVVVLVGSFWSI